MAVPVATFNRRVANVEPCHRSRSSVLDSRARARCSSTRGSQPRVRAVPIDNSASTSQRASALAFTGAQKNAQTLNCTVHDVGVRAVEVEAPEE